MKKYLIPILIVSCLVAACFILYNSNQQKLSTPLAGNEKRTLMDNIDLAMLQEYEMTKDPKTGKVPRERLMPARKYQLDLFDKQDASNIAVSGVSWSERGPNNVGGRTRALIYDLNDATRKKVWAGGVGGGIWRCNDITLATPVWTKINDLAPNLAVTTIAQHPTSPLTMYYGTGEGWFNTDAIQGMGIWKRLVCLNINPTRLT